MKRLLNIICSLLILTFANSEANAAEKLKVVATLSSYADIAQTIGGDRIEVSFVAPARFNPHFIEPRPSDVLKVKKCDLFIHSGLDLEAWRDPLLNAAARADLRGTQSERSLDLSIGIPLLEVPSSQISRAEGDIHLFGNPHYWIDPRNGIRIAKSIAVRLSKLDPEGEAIYRSNSQKFIDDLAQRMIEWNKLSAPFKGSELIAYHNEWIYLMDYLGFTTKYFLEPKPGIPPSPKQLEFIKNYIVQNHIKAVIQASFFPRDGSNYVTKGSNAKALLLAQNVGELPEANSYAAMVDYDIRSIIGSLKHE